MPLGAREGAILLRGLSSSAAIVIYCLFPNRELFEAKKNLWYILSMNFLAREIKMKEIVGGL